AMCSGMTTWSLTHTESKPRSSADWASAPRADASRWAPEMDSVQPMASDALGTRPGYRDLGADRSGRRGIRPTPTSGAPGDRLARGHPVRGAGVLRAAWRDGVLGDR